MLVKFTPAQLARVSAAAAAAGLSINDWAAEALQEHAQELIEIEAHKKRGGLHVVGNEPEEGA